MRILLKAIQLDTSIQCRTGIKTGTVDEYAERMTEGDVFPPVMLFGDEAQCWPGDGWHRVMAALQMGAVDIEAELHRGGRREALECALKANAVHGLKRTNADKRRCVEIALREFPGISSRAVAEKCGVHVDTVIAHRPQVSESDTCPPQVTSTTGRDGKQYPATQGQRGGRMKRSAEAVRERRAKAQEMRLRGMSVARIAAELGVNVSTVSDYTASVSSQCQKKLPSVDALRLLERALSGMQIAASAIADIPEECRTAEALGELKRIRSNISKIIDEWGGEADG